VALATLLCGPTHDLGISQCKKGKNFLLLRNIDILSERRANNSKKKHFYETNTIFKNVGL
jgi:hypothetical protein